MGCLCSTGLSEENSLRTFNVVNVDDMGQERNPGSIEISESELVWYQRGKEPIRWPLKSLRRYGFDAELFSFESGRRCPTGPGIYAFKCRRAEALFNLLQESIQRQRSGQDDVSAPPPLHLPGGNHQTQAVPRSNAPASSIVDPRVTELPRATASRPNSTEVTTSIPVATVPRGSASPPLYVNNDVPHQVSGRGHEYMNTNKMSPSEDARPATTMTDSSVVSLVVPPLAAAASSQDPVIQYAELDLPRPEDGATTADNSPAHLLNGHGPTRWGGEAVQVTPSSQQAMYVNIPSNQMKAVVPSPGKASGGATSNGLVPRPQTYRDNGSTGGHGASASAAAASKMNYIQIDHGEREAAATGLNQSPMLSANILSTPESPARTKTDTYATIDIERTQALSNNHRRCSIDDEGLGPRKTRHDSNIEDMYGPET